MDGTPGQGGTIGHCMSRWNPAHRGVYPGRPTPLPRIYLESLIFTVLPVKSDNSYGSYTIVIHDGVNGVRRGRGARGEARPVSDGGEARERRLRSTPGNDV